MTSLWIRGGTVIDGSGAPPFRADVLVEDGRIADILPSAVLSVARGFTVSPSVLSAQGEGVQPNGIVEGRSGEAEVDASGMYVAPGFIDIHSHSDFTLVIDPRAVSSISQGVTLEVIGNCGHGVAPLTQPELFASNIYGYRPDIDIPWHSVGEYLERLDQARPAVNVAALVPNGNLRLAVAGLVDRGSTRDELDRMKRLLAEGMEQGAFGYSTGLEYGPERACGQDEIAELARVAAQYGGLYATHTRNRAGEAVETIAEAIRTSEASGAPLQISHISSVARLADDGRWAVAQALKQVDAARARSMDVTFDMHTRLFGTTNLSAVLPPWAIEGTQADIAARLRDPAVRRALKGYSSIVTALARNDWTRIVIYESKIRPEISRKSIAALSAAHDTPPLDTIYDILLEHMDSLHELMIIAFAYREEDIRPAFQHPVCMVGSDATALAPEGPLAAASFHGAYTWAAWFYRHFARDTKLMTPEQAIRRITALPAQRLGLTDRGIIKKGAWADLAIFDPASFAERGTTFEPNQVAAGMKYVLVNGVVEVRDGKLTGERSGQVLRRR